MERNSQLLLLCSHSPNDVSPAPQRNVSIAAVRGAVRPSKIILNYFKGSVINWHGFIIFAGMKISFMLFKLNCSDCPCGTGEDNFCNSISKEYFVHF